MPDENPTCITDDLIPSSFDDTKSCLLLRLRSIVLSYLSTKTCIDVTTLAILKEEEERHYRQCDTKSWVDAIAGHRAKSRIFLPFRYFIIQYNTVVSSLFFSGQKMLYANSSY